MYLKQVVVLFIVLLFAVVVKAQPTWTVNSASYEYDMTVTCVVSLNDTLVENTKGVIIGAFDASDNCVGTAEAIYYTSVQKYRVPLMIFSNTNGAVVTLKAYIPEQPDIFDISTTIQFESNGSLGNFAVPYELMANTTSTDIHKANDELTDMVAVFPNPASEVLTFHVRDDHEPYHVLIFSLTGEMLEKKDYNGGEETINIAHLTSGTYLVQVKTNKGICTKKFIKR